MGTHPIFESDFDCLTDKSLRFAFIISQVRFEMVSEAAEESVPETMPAVEVNEFNEHPLECSWDLWYLSADKNKEWDDRLTKLMTFSTVEAFWALYHHVQLPSRLPIGSDYMLFKSGIQPKWEDEKNADGGKWTLETNKSFRTQLDATWLETLLAVIGEGFGEEGENINGAVVQVRKRVDRLQLWTGPVKTEEQALHVGRHYKGLLKMDEKMPVQFQAHKDAITRKGSTVPARYRV